MTIKLIKTDSEFLEVAATVISVGNERWYYMPFWYKKVGDGLYESCNFQNLPPHVVKHIEDTRQVHP